MAKTIRGPSLAMALMALMAPMALTACGRVVTPEPTVAETSATSTPPAVLFHTSAENSLGLKDQLPTLSQLIDEGVYGPLSSSIPCITVPA